MALQDLTPQLRTRLRRVERLVTLFVVAATVLLMAGFVYYLYHTAARKGWFTPKVKYYTLLMSGEGLKVGDAVVMMGFSVGEITQVEAQPPDSYYAVYIEFTIRRPYYGYIWTDSKLKVVASGFLGARRLEIIKGYAGKPTVQEKQGEITGLLVKGEYVSPLNAKALYLAAQEDVALTERAEKLLSQVESALPNILSLTNRLNTLLDSTTALTSNATVLTANANVLVTDLRPTVTNLTGQLDTTFANVNLTITNANAQLTLLAGSLNQTLLNLASITSNLNVQVQSNDQILSEISDLIRETDDMLQGLKRHWLLKSAFTDDAPPPPPLILEPTTGGTR
jgi:phospholipid/cholesterol/gamma-HCH transport system substrate-binding protein